ncbi:glycosyltransferase family 2 protein [Chryseobacterium sp. RU33C]|uniref:glycosyltransferase family 2 protein n=1 Tax=Chryseobacterium sp. RU33C TaxID=1907398 RepID=UPI000955AB10|nr:glycosyltransferase family 2 protein [Chryseobacterium sp. RU33C]SIR12523.1 Glycosyltransferase involved in cell wall bisynthesis [Chryseobacterium sp. RU33C]
MKLITVFTPTYNREKELSKLYESLLRQTFSDFEWLIVDDGSTDDTSLLIKQCIDDGKISIKYHKTNNGGKHRAINKGLDLAEGELFFIVDSDDYLPDNSLEIIEDQYKSIKGDDSFIGVVGYRASPKGNIIGNKQFPTFITDSNLIERREKFGVIADMAKVLITEKFREFHFPDIDGEKFVAESIVWNRMAMKYKFRYFNEAIYITEYLEGGLSYNSIRNRRKNAKYATLLYKELANNSKSPLKLKIKSIINYWRFAFCKNESIFKLLKEVGVFPLSLIFLPFGFGLYLRDSFSNDINIKKLNNER